MLDRLGDAGDLPPPYAPQPGSAGQGGGKRPQVSALYDPAKDRLVLKARPGPWAMAVALLVLGVLLVLGGSVLLLRTMLW